MVKYICNIYCAVWSMKIEKSGSINRSDVQLQCWGEIIFMSKKSVKIATTYFVTIIISLLLIGGGGYFVITSYLNSDNEENALQPLTTAATRPEDYEPYAEDCQTVLFIYDSEKRMDGVCFVLTRFIPTENRVVIMPLQSDIYSEIDGRSNSLYEFYRLGGTADAVKAVENAAKITVDKYMKLSTASFTIFSNFMGNITYSIPYNLVYENESTGENTIMKAGEQILDSGSLRKIMTYPNFKGGEEYRATVCGTLLADLVNSGSKGILKDNTDIVFTDIINSDVETNITRYDYDEKKPAIAYLLGNNDSPAQLELPAGAYNSDGFYVLDETFINALPRILSLE